MQSRTTKKTRSRAKPYTKATPSSGSSQPVPPIVASTSTSATLSKEKSTPTFREGFIKICERFHPGIKPRDDWDLFVLASTRGPEYGVSNEDFYTYSDNYYIEDFTAEEIQDGRALAKRIKGATELLDTPGAVCGVKPDPGDDDVYVCPVPNSEYSIRMWGTNLERNHEYCIDFVETATGKPVNSPFKKYELWAVPNKRTPWLPSPTQRLSSLERGFGVKEKDIPPGEEKFVLMEGTACILKRPGMRTVYFEAPVRPRPPVDTDLSSFDELDFGFSSMKRCGFCQCCKSIPHDNS